MDTWTSLQSSRISLQTVAQTKQQFTPNSAASLKKTCQQPGEAAPSFPDAFTSLPQHTRLSPYTLHRSKQVSEKSTFTLYEHKLDNFSHSHFKIWLDLRGTENLLFLEQIQEGDRDAGERTAVVKGHLCQMLGSLCTFLPAHVQTGSSSIKTLSWFF